jgi:uncharacterized protein (TIGR02284 family)
MHDTAIGHFKSLHTAAVDAANGYQEALKRSENAGFTELFETMAMLHARDAQELAAGLSSVGVEHDNSGSLLSLINKTIMDIRSLFGGLNASVLPGLIDGELRIIAKYEEALEDANMSFSNVALLRRQRNRLNEAVVQMRETETWARETHAAS